MHKLLMGAALGAMVAFGTAVSAQAAPVNFDGTYAVTANSNTDGLTISTANDLGNPFSLPLVIGTPMTVDLFDIWTPESSIQRDDLVPQQISVAFNFTSPPPPFGGDATGTTVGQSIFFGFYQDGHLEWNNPLDIVFGANNDGLLRIELSGGDFNGGFFGLDSRPGEGLTVAATFTEVRAASVPEPASIALFGVSVIGLGFAVGRKRRRAA